VSNSIKFTAKGSICFEAKLKNKNTLQLIVSDTGIGIPKDKLKTIFAQYEQVRTKVQKKYKGTGLGLAISKKLVELMNGSIIIKSKINEGTSFVISLPFEKAAMQKSTTTELHQKDTAFLSGKTFLLTDDIDDNRFVIAETLRFFNKDIIVLEAEDGQQALDVLKNNQVDFVIMDLDMPVMNGFEALSEIRKNKKIKHLKVIASTASLITNGEDEFLEFGFNGYLPKPFDIDNFFLLLEKMLK
jgi:CheY-like chemotaxis protein